MTHLDEGRLRAWLDDELTAADRTEVESLLEESAAARAALEGLRRQQAVVADALELVDGAPPTERVRQRLERALAPLPAEGHGGGVEARARSAGWWVRRSRLAQAALLVVLLAGGASAALPGSPVRGWIEGLVGGGGGEAVESVPATAAAAGERVGARIAPADGRVDLALDGLPEGTVVEVVLVDDDRATVTGPRGTRFRTGAGRLSATVFGGPVEVRIPRSVAATLRVNDRMYLRKTDEELTLPGPVSDRSPARLSFEVGG